LFTWIKRKEIAMNSRMKKVASDFSKLCGGEAVDGGPGSGQKGHTTPSSNAAYYAKLDRQREVSKNPSPEAMRNMKRDLRNPAQISRAYGVSHSTVEKAKGRS
jgi:hypothetical protein